MDRKLKTPASILLSYISTFDLCISEHFFYDKVYILMKHNNYC